MKSKEFLLNTLKRIQSDIKKRHRHLQKKQVDTELSNTYFFQPRLEPALLQNPSKKDHNKAVYDAKLAILDKIINRINVKNDWDHVDSSSFDFFSCVAEIEATLSIKIASTSQKNSNEVVQGRLTGPRISIEKGHTKSLRDFQGCLQKYISKKDNIHAMQRYYKPKEYPTSGSVLSRSKNKNPHQFSVFQFALAYLSVADSKKQKTGIIATDRLLRKLRKKSHNPNQLCKIIIGWCKHGAFSRARDGERGKRTRLYFATQMLKSIYGESLNSKSKGRTGIGKKLFEMANRIHLDSNGDPFSISA